MHPVDSGWTTRSHWTGPLRAMSSRSIHRVTFAARLVTAVLISLVAAAHVSGAMPEPSRMLLRDDTVCLGCHEESAREKAAPSVATDELRRSAHRTLVCVDCHRDLDRVPHTPGLAPVDCGHCHEPPPPGSIEDSYVSRHRREQRQPDVGMPGCIDCHGGHDTFPVLDAGPTEAVHLVDRCLSCHTDASSEYMNSVHGKGLLAGDRHVPTCASCHPEHLHRGAQERAGVFEAGAVATCVSCHDDPGLQEQYALPGDRMKSYLGSYHGTARYLGDTRTADCVSCHGYHDVLPSSDPNSSTHPDNLGETCGGCHPGVTENVAKGRVHVMATKESGTLLYYINFGFRWFTFAVIGGLVGHIGLELFGRLRRRNGD